MSLREIGIELPENPNYVSGKIKHIPEDFKVEEVTPDGKTLKIGQPEASWDDIPGKGDQLIFKLEKKKWDTMLAVKEIAERLYIGPNRIGYAGTKDRQAITTQRMSIWNVEPKKIQNLRIKDMTFYPIEKSKERLNLGDLKGNRFIITIREIPFTVDKTRERLETAIKEFKVVPNYFGEQRFGSARKITHKVGELMIKGSLKEAVMS
ncbi:MAG: tRNA pseudouridine(13) synthase TruD, partial [Candidatus Diapherotrites archaeon]|nr:tRNA pseudouridine(13) synthase TruD [Candidatus Diapherotrites archaeon]